MSMCALWSDHRICCFLTIRWHRRDPFKAVLAAIVFGAAAALQLSQQLYRIDVPPQLLLALPYILTIIAMSGLVGKANQPEAFMTPYRRE